MKTNNRLVTGTRSALIVVLSSSALLHAAEDRHVIADAVGGGKVSLNIRARYEGVDQTGVQGAEALTVRTRLGITTAAVESISVSLEAENVAALDGDKYNQAGLNPEGAGRAVVADPEGTEINQAWIAYTSDDGPEFRFGRQRLVLDNARFVGDVGWRQNMQTFDAAMLQGTPADHLNVTYAYLDRINRIFGSDHAQGRWNSDSHLLHGTYDGFANFKVSGYAYLLDFDSAAANSCDTFGISAVGSAALDMLKITYRAEYARQSDAGANPVGYSTDYLSGEVGLGAAAGTLALGYEILGTDNGVGFKTPLATLHAFNGWADMFLATPGDGLRDLYWKGTAKLPAGFNLLGFYHRFESDLGADLGSELDLQLARKFNQYCSGVLKFATFNSDTTSRPDVDKIWLQVEFSY